MATYICLECNYRFESSRPQEGRKCPYCGKGRLAQEPGAEELLTEE